MTEREKLIDIIQETCQPKATGLMRVNYADIADAILPYIAEREAAVWEECARLAERHRTVARDQCRYFEASEAGAIAENIRALTEKEPTHD